MTRFALYCLFTIISPVGLAFVAEARAQSSTPEKAKVLEAKTYVDAGMTAQDNNDYDTAIRLYRKAYELVPHPLLLFDIAQALRLAGRMDEAVELYRTYLAGDASGHEARIAHEELAEIARRKAEQALEVAQASSATSMTRSGVDWTARRKLAVVAAAGGVLAVVGGAVLGVSAERQEHEAYVLCGDPGLPCVDGERATALVRAAHARAIEADVAFGAGAVAAIAAGLLWVTGKGGREHRVVIMPMAASGVLVTSSASF